MAQIIYVLVNEAMPGLLKIGRTTDELESRIDSLSRHSGVPLPFECYFAAEVPNAESLERKLHQLFAENRINAKREFFNVDPERVIIAITIGQFKEITPGKSNVAPEEQLALENARARRPNIKLEALGIKSGDVLVFSRDEFITATVVEGGRLDLKGEILSPSAAALKILHSLGYSCPTANGYAYWMFQGELITERRARIEAEAFGGK
jgi:hypothetical protein